jgi:hypothetical protein
LVKPLGESHIGSTLCGRALIREHRVAIGQRVKEEHEIGMRDPPDGISAGSICSGENHRVCVGVDLVSTRKEFHSVLSLLIVPALTVPLAFARHFELSNSDTLSQAASRS